jgi:hypothetical protein
MKSSKPFRRYVLVERREAGAGVHRLKLAPVTGVLEVAPCGPGGKAKRR